MISLKLSVENYLRQNKTVIKSRHEITKFNHIYQYKTLENIFEAFNVFGAITSLDVFKRLWKKADARLFYSVNEETFIIVYDYTKQQSEDNNVYHLR